VPLTILSFFPSGSAQVLTEAALREAAQTARALAPAKARVEVRSLDRTFVQMRFPEGGGAPEVVIDGERLAPLFAPAVMTITFDDNIEDAYLRVSQTADALHGKLGARGTGIFDGRLHLDEIREGATRGVLALAMNVRRSDMDRDDYFHYYLGRHVPMAIRLTPPLVIRYRTFRPLHTLGDFRADSVTFQEFESEATLMAFFQARVADGDAARDDAAEFIQSLVYYVGERAVSA